MTATLTKPIIVPQYNNGIIDLYTPDPVTGAPVVDSNFTVNVGTILTRLFPGQTLTAAPNAVTLHGNDLFFTQSSGNSQAVFELPNYLQNPTAAIANAFVVTLDGSDYVGLAFDSTGHLYTAEGSYGDNQIVRYTLPTTIPTGAQAAQDNYVAGSRIVLGNAGATSYFGDLTFDAAGNLWAADYQNSRVVAFAAASLATANAPYHAIVNPPSALATANTGAGLSTTTPALFSDPEGVAFDGAGGTGNLWVGNNNDGGSQTKSPLDSLVEITPALQALALATPNNGSVSTANVKPNNNVFIYNVGNNTGGGGSTPQFGGLAIDTTNGVLYANEEVAGDAREYTLSTIAATPANPAATQIPLTTTNPGNGGIALVTTAIACFREGTGLAGADGRMLVETLAPGMRLRTAGGELRAVVWVGHSRVDCRRHPRPDDVRPVRVSAGAIGDGLPERDLWLSPDHALLIAGHLVPVRHLLNGATIVQPADAAVVRYFHVELASHDVLLAEGLPAESYLDTGNRGAFANGGVVAQAAPDFALRVWEQAGCAPLCTAGPVLTETRRGILATAAELGFSLCPDANLRVRRGARTIAPTWSGRTASFALPPGSGPITLRSRDFRPADTAADGVDHRTLGVAVVALSLDGVEIPLDDPRLGVGWHDPEPGLRWTSGLATLDLHGSRLDVTLALLGRYWQGPEVRKEAFFL